MVKDQTISNWTQELASKNGKYGGGSAASIVGAFASSLAQFVFELQAGKEKYVSKQKQIDQAIQKSEQFNKKLLELAEVDADVFEPVLELFKLPQDTEAEKTYRRQKIDEGLKAAAQPPLEIMETMESVLDLFAELLELNVRGTIVDDIAVGLYFTEATIESARINCMSNINLIKDNELKKQLTEEVDEVYERGLKRTRELKSEALKILG